MKKSFSIFILFFAFTLTAGAQSQPDQNAGIEFYRQGEYTKAVEILQESVKAEEKDRLAWLYLDASFVKLNKDDEALKAFRKVKGIYTENIPVYDKKLKITSRVQATYTDQARRNRVSGTVKIAVEFDADGKIGFAFPFETLPDGLTESAVQAAKRTKFEPAEIDGKPITVVIIVEYGFSTF